MAKHGLWILIISIFAISCCVYFGCGQTEEEEDEDSTGCNAQVDCYENVDNCFKQADTVERLGECADAFEGCLLHAESCFWQWYLCVGDCSQASCYEQCGVQHRECRQSCGWDADCFDTCDGLLSNVDDQCGADFDCWTDTLGNLVEDCYSNCW